MILYVVLLILLVVLWYFSWRLSGYELLSPASVNTLAFMGGTLLAIIGLTSWNKIELRLDGFLILLLGSLCFSFGGILMHLYTSKKGRTAALSSNEAKVRQVKVGESSWKAPHIASWKIALLIAIVVAYFLIWLYESWRMAADAGQSFSSYSAFSKWVRSSTMASFTTYGSRLDEGYSVLYRLLAKLSSVSTIVFSLYLGVTIRNRNRRKECILCAIGLIISCGITVLKGGRGGVLLSLLCIVFAMYITDIRSGKPALKLARDYAVGFIVLVIVAVPLFYALGALVGRAPGSGLVEYISFYFGGGIPSLQYALNESINAFSLPGEATFYGIYGLLHKFYVISDIPAYASTFVDMGGHGSNIFTAYYRYFVDFGYAGVIVLSAVAGAIFTVLYEAAKRSSWTIWLAWFVYISPNLLDGQREEYLFSRMLTAGNVLVFVMLAVIIAWLEWPANKDRLRGLVPKRFRKQVPAATQGEDSVA